MAQTPRELQAERYCHNTFERRVASPCPYTCCSEKRLKEFEGNFPGVHRWQSESEKWNHTMYAEAQDRGVVWSITQQDPPREARLFDLQGSCWAVNEVQLYTVPVHIREMWRSGADRADLRKGGDPIDEADKASEDKKGGKAKKAGKVKKVGQVAKASPLSQVQSVEETSSFPLNPHCTVREPDPTPYTGGKRYKMSKMVAAARAEMPLIDGNGTAFNAFKELSSSDLSDITSEKKDRMLMEERKRSLALERELALLKQNAEMLHEQNDELREENGDLKLEIRGEVEMLKGRYEGRDMADRRATRDAAVQNGLPARRESKRKYKIVEVHSDGEETETSTARLADNEGTVRQSAEAKVSGSSNRMDLEGAHEFEVHPDLLRDAEASIRRRNESRWDESFLLDLVGEEDEPDFDWEPKKTIDPESDNGDENNPIVIID